MRSVTFTIRRADDDSVLETGLAHRCPRHVFRYETTCAVPPETTAKIEIVARDWPDNATAWYWPPEERAFREAKLAELARGRFIIRRSCWRAGEKEEVPLPLMTPP